VDPPQTYTFPPLVFGNSSLSDPWLLQILFIIIIRSPYDWRGCLGFPPALSLFVFFSIYEFTPPLLLPLPFSAKKGGTILSAHQIPCARISDDGGFGRCNFSSGASYRRVLIPIGGVFHLRTPFFFERLLWCGVNSLAFILFSSYDPEVPLSPGGQAPEEVYVPLMTPC